MQRISAGMMPLYKWVMPALSLLIVAYASWGLYDPNGAQPIWWGMALVVVAYLAQVVMSWTLADEVVDCGDRLKVRRGGIEEIIDIADIESVSVNYAMRSHRATLYLRKAGRFGKRIVFLPRANSPFGTFGASKVIEDLKQRILLASANSSHQQSP